MPLTETFGLSRSNLTGRPSLFERVGFIENPDDDAG